MNTSITRSFWKKRFGHLRRTAPPRRFLPCALLFVLVLLSIHSSSRADTVALSFSGGFVDSRANVTDGWVFSVTTPIIVTSLGYWDANNDGLVSSHQVGIWTNNSAVLLMSGTVAAGTVDPLVNGFRYNSNLTGTFLLNPGLYVIGGRTNTPDGVARSVPGGNLSLASGVSYIQDRTDNGVLAFTYPGQNAAIFETGFFGPNFTFTTVPGTLGNYPNTSVPLSTDTTVTPDAAPSIITSMTVSSSTDFKGKLEGDPATGVVRVTDAHPAGTYTITVNGFSSIGERTTTTFALTVTAPGPVCTPVSFAAPNNTAAGTIPRHLAVGDFNGDGKQDLVTANNTSNDVSILLGDGAGNMGAATNFAAGMNPFWVAVGDFNGDGKQDLAVADSGANNVSVLLGDGAGHFGAATSFTAGTSPVWVGVGDFNGDGKQDLAVANSGSSNVSILLGNGAGSFSAPTNFPTGGRPYSAAIGDFNADGKQDIVTANYTTNNVSILLGNGAGSFSAPTNFAAGLYSDSVAVGDFNGDGKQDLAVTSYFDHGIYVLLGNGSGSFGVATYFHTASTPFSVAVGDFNGDGKQDLAFGTQDFQNAVSILSGDGTGSFSALINARAGGFPISVVVGDFNGDGVQDLATSNYETGDASVMLRNCNHAPVLDASRSPMLLDENENAGPPIGMVGTRIDQLVDFALPAGQVDNVTDEDAAVLGMAVTAVDSNNGMWFYSLDDGMNWDPIGSVTDNNARLLAADGYTRLYFQPNANFSGTLPNAITFRAWDQTSGTNGDLANISPNGGATAFSITTDTASLTIIAAPTPTPTATPPFVSISGKVTYCPNSDSVPGVIMSLTGPSPAPGSTPTDALGNYTLSGLTPGGSYTVTPSKAALPSGSAGIDTMDVLAAQRHFLNIALLPAGCGRDAADVNGDNMIDTSDVVAIQRFYIGRTFGTANVGKYRFTPANRSYPGIISDQTDQNYDTLAFGDVVSNFAHRPDGPSQTAADDDKRANERPATVEAVTLPEVAVDATATDINVQVTTTTTGAKNKLVGFQGDFTFDERVVTFQSEPVQKAGLTGGNWNVSGNVLPGTGPIRTLRVSAYSNDFTPLSGEGTLFELSMTRVSKAAQGTPVISAAPLGQFIFIDADLKVQKPGSTTPGGLPLHRRGASS